MIKYRTRFESEIEALEVIKETEKQIVFVGNLGAQNRESKRSDWQNWHDTFEDARQFLLEKSESEAVSLRKRLEEVKKRIETIKGLKEQELGE